VHLRHIGVKIEAYHAGEVGIDPVSSGQAKEAARAPWVARAAAIVNSSAFDPLLFPC
jgi:hypothetical protein